MKTMKQANLLAVLFFLSLFIWGLPMHSSASASKGDLADIAAPRYSQPAGADTPSAKTLLQNVQNFVSAGYRVSTEHSPRFFKVAADTTPDMIRKSFANQVNERGGKPVNFDGPELADHQLNILALFNVGRFWSNRFLGVAMSRTHPGQNEDALVIYFTLEPKD